MAGETRPVFLERRSYRRRRMRDALRLVALLGLVLWMIPILWPGADGADTVPMSRALFYVFGVWILLIAISACLALSLRSRAGSKSATSAEADTPG